MFPARAQARTPPRHQPLRLRVRRDVDRRRLGAVPNSDLPISRPAALAGKHGPTLAAIKAQMYAPAVEALAIPTPDWG